ncbi:AAA family ATPase [Nitrosophilus labii]|uniref:AAA family ATPase n=1 Tax=Nitrosophilus labii TaxID=2706014 RepID=UPI00165707A3|nr:MoxR family ATPase [Nitrosophilus labii]
MIFQDIKKEISKIIVGQNEMIESILIALLTQGHLLLEGLPGLAKTTTVNILAKTLGIDFKRVQFTPDLLPSDIIGAQIYDMSKNSFYIKQGPVFTNLLLADEINRAPAKVQSALLEAMQERQVTIAENCYKLPTPFIVMATQNPIEQEGTYSLPEAQLDRFMMKILLDYPDISDEFEILNRAEKNFNIEIKQVADAKTIENAKNEVENVHIDDELKKYILNIVFSTRKHQNLMYGSSPRGSIDLLKTSKAKAYLKGKDFVTPKDILEVVKPTLRHRVILTYEARAKNITPDYILDEIIKELPIP